MQLYRQFGIDLNKKEVISIVGGGGKTTSIKFLAKELKDLGFKVLVTTSTQVFVPIETERDYFFLEEIPTDYIPIKETITILGEKIVNAKLIGTSLDKIEEINNRNLFDYILIEADGAKNKPIKAPNLNEPLVVSSTTITVGVIGIDSIGCNINTEMVHRPEILLHLLNVMENHILSSNDIVNLSLHPDGLFKNAIGKKILFLNKVSSDIDISYAKDIREKLKNSDIKIVIGDVLNKKYF